MEYIPLSDNFCSEPLYFPLEDLEQPVFFNNGEDPYKLMEEFYSTLPPSWFKEVDALLYSGKDPPAVNVGDPSMPDVPELSVSPDPYNHSNIDVVGYSPIPVPELIVSPGPSVYSNIEAGYASTPIPEPTVSPEPIDYNLNQWQRYSTNLESASYIVPHGYADPSMRYHDPSYIGYTASSLYSTHWELDASNSQNPLHNKRMGPGMSSFDIPLNHAMQRSQELDFSLAFGPEQHFIGNTLGFPVSLYPANFDESTANLSPIPTTFSSPFFSTSEILPFLSPSPPFPTLPESLPHLSPTVTASSTPFSSTPDDGSDALPDPSPIVAARPHPPHHQPSKKRGRKPKKDTNTPPAQEKPRRKFPNGRSSVQSQAWIDQYFSDGVCRICKKEPSKKKRMDRILEHLVSVHFFHAVRNVERFELVQEEDVRHFIGTKAQFEYTQEYINSIRCSFCPDASLVFRGRGKSLVDHLTRRHGDVEEEKLEEEKERLKELISISKRGKFYNVYDQFLYGYPSGASTELP